MMQKKRSDGPVVAAPVIARQRHREAAKGGRGDLALIGGGSDCARSPRRCAPRDDGGALAAIGGGSDCARSPRRCAPRDDGGALAPRDDGAAPVIARRAAPWRPRSNHLLTLYTLICAIAIAITTPAAADPWQYGVSLDLGAIHSDNIFLAEEGLEESETIYQVSPVINLTKESERVNANINYAPQALFYQDIEDADEVYHVLDAALNTTLLRDRFFVDFSAVNFQVIDAAETRFPTSNIPITTRRTDTAIWSVTPRWQEQLGPAQLLAQGTFRQTNFDETDTLETLDSDEKSGQLQINNYREQQGVSWALRYQYTRLDYDGEALPWEYQQAAAELGFWIGSGLRIFGSGGVETPFDAFLEPDMKDTFWEAGFAYNPDERLELEIAGGERSFGTSLRGRLAYVMRRGRTELTYSENPSTHNNALSGRRPIQQTDNLDDFLTRLNNNNKFIRKRAEWLTSIELNKTTITFRLFNEEREQTFTLEGDPRPDESYRGAALRINWNVGAKLSLGLTGDIADRDGGVSEEELTRFGIDATYDLSRRFTLTARAQRSEEDSQGGAFGNYTENQYHLTLRTEIL